MDTSLSLFGKTFRYPFFAGPVGAVNLHYGEKYNDMEYNQILVKACSENGIAAFTGDGTANVRFTHRKEQAWNIGKTERGRGCPF